MNFLFNHIFLGVLTIFYVVLLIVLEYAMGGHTPGVIKHKPEEWTDVFAVIPVICFGYQVIFVLLLFIHIFQPSVSCVGDSHLLLHEASNDQALHHRNLNCDWHLCCRVYGSSNLWLPNLWLEGGRRHHLQLLGHETNRHDRSHCHGSQDLHHLSHITLLRQVCVIPEIPKYTCLC